MTNLANVLKAEVARLARKELRAETEDLKKTVATQKAEIAALKRRTLDLEKALKALMRQAAAGAERTKLAVSSDSDESHLRFRAAGMASNRKRLGLNAADFGLLIGATGQSVYLWESGKSKPNRENLASIAALRGAGKREVSAKLQSLKQPGTQ